ncbi:hypothetical protein HX045_04550 [Myroides odoratimimus]|uniref:Uncharacterized protein n=4 Tax=Myroides odoratimimus TaxID=76832 RepID=A0A0U2XRN5_9FLAO|nr:MULTISPECIES: hypothetical protein [Myroides]OJR74374.1 hypothetical protein BK387_30950 [Escherichia coli]AJA68774.1 hypothetical protein MYRA21_1622 [Myroides sp. A21]ALU26033.1 hypothetical protein AS202_07690 [Myroides odoratimimus]APA92081.1 hypothetical protein BK054_07570 [Myroides sp. ZB35]EHO11071.1 hypothetical protein HMPREF9712_00728 [Myroides odoratimimus CCUG 10230]
MKKILLLFVILMSISTSYGQRKSKKQEEPVKKIEYLDIVQILSNKDELKLTQKQVGALTIKNEYIKRDLQNLNSKTKMQEVEKNMHQRQLFAGYDNFVNRTLNEDQLESWNVIKKEIAASEEESTDLKTEMAALDSAYKAELKEVYRKYSKDRKLYYASRNVVRKQYDADKLRIYKKYNQAVEEEGEEGDKVLTLEEIANLYKEYDDYYNEPTQANPLEYLDVKEEYSNETEEITSEEEGEY